MLNKEDTIFVLISTDVILKLFDREIFLIALIVSVFDDR